MHSAGISPAVSWNSGMGDQDVNRLYEQIIDEGGERGDLVVGAGSERRTAPRLQTKETELTVRAELTVNAIDISVSGLAFFSSFPVQVGQPLNVTLGTMFTVDAEVVQCRLEKANEDFTETSYRVQCKFPEEEQGKYMLVAIKELEKRKG